MKNGKKKKNLFFVSPKIREGQKVRNMRKRFS